MKAAVRARLLASLLIAAALASVIATITLEPPAKQRQRKMDAQRERDLTAIQRAVNEYWRRRALLPVDLDVLAAEPGFRVGDKDPESGTPYAYEVTGLKSFRLCAEFALNAKADPVSNNLPTELGWTHSSGRQCFDLVVKDR